MKPPPRQARRRQQYCDDVIDIPAPRVRIARLLEVPGCLMGGTVSEAVSPAEGRETEVDAYNCSQKASPGPYTGQSDESLLQDSISFWWEEDSCLLDPFETYIDQ
jgi:hypothetical protein